jgi:hypothetical protein
MYLLARAGRSIVAGTKVIFDITSGTPAVILDRGSMVELMENLSQRLANNVGQNIQTSCGRSVEHNIRLF